MHILRAVQVAVLDGKLSASDVALYWVEQEAHGGSRLRPIQVRADASLQGWPPGVFEEEQGLAREILTKRWAREDGT